MKIAMTITSVCVGALAALTAALVSEEANEEIPAQPSAALALG